VRFEYLFQSARVRFVDTFGYLDETSGLRLGGSRNAFVSSVLVDLFHREKLIAKSRVGHLSRHGNKTREDKDRGH
jgi:hypothetical protein